MPGGLKVLLALSLIAAAGALIVLIATSGGPRPAPWYVREWVNDRDRPGESRRYELTPAARRIPIAIDPEHCWLEDRSAVERIEVVETDEDVTITAYADHSSAEEDCLTVHNRRARLEAPLGGRTLVDGATGEEAPIAPSPEDWERMLD